MLKLINLNKKYNEQSILNNINIKFNNQEKVMILGPSGSGKTTLLNMLFKLDKPTSGLILYKNKNIMEINDSEYHRKFGYILQNCELIDKLSVKENILLPSIISNNKNNNFDYLIKELNIKHLLNKKISTLSGGEKQKVAIARALINDPEIIIADEPTGSLDSNNSKMIMDLIMKLTKDKLLIMVTHNESLAASFSSRIIRLKDGKIINDSNNNYKYINYDYKNIKTKSLNIFKTLQLTLKNIKTKKTRFSLILFSSIIGLTSLSLVINLNSSLNHQIDQYKNNSLKNFPIIINETNEINSSGYSYPNDDIVKPALIENKPMSINQIEYINNIDSSLLLGKSNTYLNNIYLLTKNHKFIPSGNILTLPKDINNYNDYLFESFDLIKGHFPTNKNEIVLIINGNNEISRELLEILDKNIINTELKLLSNNEIYLKNKSNYYINNDLKDMYISSNLNLKITGILRGKVNNQSFESISGLGINEYIIDDLININKNSNIIKSQMNNKNDIITGEIVNNIKDTLLKYNYNDIPLNISLYPINNNARDIIIEYLNNYDEKIIYTDYASTLLDMTNSIISVLTVGIFIFSLISLIIIVVMISILSYISVLENQKYIGILRVLGTKIKDIRKIFNNENLIIGILSSIISYILSNLIIKQIYKYLFEVKYVSNLNNFLILLIVGSSICLIGGFIPINKYLHKNIKNNIIGL